MQAILISLVMFALLVLAAIIVLLALWLPCVKMVLPGLGVDSPLIRGGRGEYAEKN